MDTRLVELLPAAIGFKNGDIKILKNAGGILSHPYGSVMRGLIVAIYKLGVESVWVVGHTDCGMEKLNVSDLVNKMVERGVSKDTIDMIEYSGIDYEKWLGGFESSEEAVHETMKRIAIHPLMPKDITIEGLMIDSQTGEITHLESIGHRE